MKTKFIVINENILGYIGPFTAPHTAGVLASSVLRGASHDWKDGPYPIRQDRANCRPATRADFKAFRVESKGYENDPTYDFPAA